MQKINENDLLTAALTYNAAGFSVIPLLPRKKIAFLDGWQKYSITQSTKEEIEQWWSETPDANVGIALGPSNGKDGRYLFVVDQDAEKDPQTKWPLLNPDGSFKQLGDVRGCPATLSQTTGSGATQFFYWAPQGYVVKNPTPRPLINIKGIGGYVVAPPSIHPITGKTYDWNMEELLPENISEFPQDSLDALLGGRASSQSSVRQVLGGVPVGQGLRHVGIAQVAGFYLTRAKTQEEITMARTALYAWDKEMNKSPERWEERKRELDNTFDGILAKEMSKPNRLAWTGGPVTPSLPSKPILLRFSNIKTEPIQWLWPERIALGKLTMIVGDPDVGKSLLTACIAAIVSKGYQWPVDQSSCPIGDVIFLSAEDDAGDTIKPRLEAAGADMNRVHVLKAIQVIKPDGTETERMFSLEEDLSAIEETLESLNDCKVVIIDPISAYLGQTDSHRNAAVRGLLAPLAALAAKWKVALIVIDHLNKNSREGNALYRSGGSLAFVAAARAAFLVVRDPENTTRKMVMPIKNNIAKEQERAGLAYSIVTAENGAPVIAWEPEPIAVKAKDILSQLQSHDTKVDTDWTISFLEDLLADGPMLADNVFAEGEKAHHTKKEIRRACAKLGIKPKKSDFRGPWVWALPDRRGAEQQTAAEEPIKEF